LSSAGTVEWAVFAALVAGLLFVDVVFAGRSSSRRQAWMWSGIWLGVALGFGLWLTLRDGPEVGLTYLTAYFLEKSLSIDNLVVFALVFSQTGIQPRLQRRVLFWGVFGALILRAALIASGIYLLARFQWLVYPFGALLAYAAFTMWRGEQQRRLWVETSCALCTSWISRFVPIVPEPHGHRFIVKVDGRRHATPLLVALVAIEGADLLFAVDSIPAVLAITRDPFLVYTSNIFALLGLRSLYSVIGDLVSRFQYLRIGLSVLLVFVAAKLVLTDFVHIPPGISLGVIAAILGLAAAASRWLPEPIPKEGGATGPCSHRGAIKVLEPAVHVCPQCVAKGDSWVQLRMCMSCGQVGCCDSSKNRHATGHFKESGHPIMRSIEPGERWKWCYVDKTVVD
jgi:tellurite resistance protein TerC